MGPEDYDDCDCDRCRGGRAIKFLKACAEGCYKHLVNGSWVCCKCGE